MTARPPAAERRPLRIPDRAAVRGPGDFVATDGVGDCAAGVAGRLADTMPLCDCIAWTPAAPCVVHDDPGGPTVQGSHVMGATALSFATAITGTGVALFCAAGPPGFVQPVAPACRRLRSRPGPSRPSCTGRRCCLPREATAGRS